MKYLIIGNKGQLGSEFEARLTSQSQDIVAVDIDKVDICDYQQVTDLFSFVKPSIVINCAAYNDVDAAESNIDTAFQVNSEAVKYLAYTCYKRHSFFIHFSSDYVFDGNKTEGMYNENDVPNPINQYGNSKLSGELLLKDEIENYLLFRLSWVYGKGTQNFMYKLSQWAKDNTELKITQDEVSIPTSTELIVDIVMKSIKQAMEGLYHLTSSVYCSRIDWAESIVKQLGLNVKLLPVQQDYFNLPAKRPKFSAMDNKKISGDLDIEIPHWEYDLVHFLSGNIQTD